MIDLDKPSEQDPVARVMLEMPVSIAAAVKSSDDPDDSDVDFVEGLYVGVCIFQGITEDIFVSLDEETVMMKMHTALNLPDDVTMEQWEIAQEIHFGRGGDLTHDQLLLGADKRAPGNMEQYPAKWFDPEFEGSIVRIVDVSYYGREKISDDERWDIAQDAYESYDFPLPVVDRHSFTRCDGIYEAVVFLENPDCDLSIPVNFRVEVNEWGDVVYVGLAGGHPDQ